MRAKLGSDLEDAVACVLALLVAFGSHHGHAQHQRVRATDSRRFDKLRIHPVSKMLTLGRRCEKRDSLLLKTLACHAKETRCWKIMSTWRCCFASLVLAAARTPDGISCRTLGLESLSSACRRCNAHSSWKLRCRARDVLQQLLAGVAKRSTCQDAATHVTL